MYHPPIKTFIETLSNVGFDDKAYPKKKTLNLLEDIGQFCSSSLLPLYSDTQLHFNHQKHIVNMPKGYQKTYQTMCQLGYPALEHPTAIGGHGVPKALACLIQEMMMSCHSPLFLGLSLTQSAVIALNEYAPPEIKKVYLKKMIQGQWTGSMCLTESHCGTDLGLIRTKAIPHKDYYHISGSKIWITFGEHDLTENIIHLVLAKLPNAPPGSKGISLFLVPKLLPNGKRNAVYCQGLEHKMGTHVSPTCSMSFDHAVGWLIGEPNHGLHAMFSMMNDARLTVANQGIALAEIAFQKGFQFLKQHQRSSLAITTSYAYHLAMRSLMVYTCLAVDQGDEDRVSLLTPILKSYFTETSCQHIQCVQKIIGLFDSDPSYQTFQYYLDARISMIYEGTNGIQANDYVLRKLPKDQFRVIHLLIDEMKTATPTLKNNSDYHSMIQHFESTLNQIKKSIETDLEAASACAPYFLKMSALMLLGFMWTKETNIGHESLKVCFFNRACKEVKMLKNIIHHKQRYLFHLQNNQF
ncbi:MAG: hypothetical protein CMF42_00935 [Legionellales bacterium]|nr:hypothetical protein [Legionellales bacterium]